ncbi:T9SS type A sorting domain-containing protein [Kordia sp.]|uniref:T9SS type A sorting domain-containing protein n=1 Tax=Kordia sp. TaxID=1965332 RepID=UPI003B5A174E
MKKIYFLIVILLFSFSSKAQTDPDLLGQWFLHYVEYTNSNRLYPPIGPTIDINFHPLSDPNFIVVDGNSSCNSFYGNYEVNNSNSSVDIINLSVTLAFCDGDTFDPSYLSIISDNTNNFYDYTIDLQTETLTMIDLLGTKLVYGRQVLSTKENDSFSNIIKLYPNPVQKELFVNGISSNSKVTYTIYNVIGNVVTSENLLQQYKINVQSLKAGIYFVQIQQEGKTAIKKFVKL